jgi:hypothetical protein
VQGDVEQGHQLVLAQQQQLGAGQVGALDGARDTHVQAHALQQGNHLSLRVERRTDKQTWQVHISKQEEG